MKKVTKKLTRSVKEPARLKLALKPFSPEVLDQLEKELTKKMRSELFRKIKFQSKVGTKGKSKEIKKQSLKIAKKKFSDKIKATMLKKKIGAKAAAKKISEDFKVMPKDIDKSELTVEVKEKPEVVEKSELTAEVKEQPEVKDTEVEVPVFLDSSHGYLMFVMWIFVVCGKGGFVNMWGL